MYTLWNRKPGLFNSIHHGYYRADSQVLSFFMYIYNSSFFSYSVSDWPLPTPSLPCLPLRENHHRCTICHIWCEDWCRISVRAANSLVVSFLYDLVLFFLRQLLIGFASIIIHCRCQAPPHIYRTNEMWH